MRIIDKNRDYYDYLADPTDTLVFDRRNSWLITKEDICKAITYSNDEKHAFFLLQCGGNYWLFFATATEIKRDNGFHKVTNYSLELLSTWKNYDKPLKLLNLTAIEFNSMWSYRVFDYKDRSRILLEDAVRKNAAYFIDAILHGDYRVTSNFSQTYEDTYDSKGRYLGYNARKKVEMFPILKACGIANLIDPETMYYAIDEYFSLMKTASEKSEAEGTTNNDKIINHGFDTKTSFRGK